MLWVVAALAALLGLLALLLLAPVRLRVAAQSAPPRLRVELRLFGGLVRLAPVDSARRRQVRASRAPATKPERRRGWRPSRRFIKALPHEALAVLRAIRLERLHGELRLGLEDPAMTGELYGRLGAVLVALPLRSRFRLVPLFDREAIEAEGELALSLVPARLLPVGARLLWALR